MPFGGLPSGGDVQQAGRALPVDVADQAVVDAVADQLAAAAGGKPRRPVAGRCRAAGSPAGGSTRRSSSWRCRRAARRCGWRRRRARGSRATRARCPSASRPGPSRSARRSRGCGPRRCDAGTTAGGAVGLGEVGERPHRVAHRRHVRLGQRDAAGRRRGSAGPCSPGPIAIDERHDTRHPGSRTPSTTGSTASCDRDGLEERAVGEQVVDPPGVAALEVVGRRCDPEVAFEAVELGHQRVGASGVEGVGDDRVALGLDGGEVLCDGRHEVMVGRPLRSVFVVASPAR